MKKKLSRKKSWLLSERLVGKLVLKERVPAGFTELVARAEGAGAGSWLARAEDWLARAD